MRGLVKYYHGRAVVNGLDFDVPAGTVFALLGPNGAGKTTTIEILEGYRRPDAGSARVFDLDPARDRERLMARVGLMLQGGGLYPQITPREALGLFASFYRDPIDPNELLEQLQLHSVARTRFRHLSGGERQRLGLALALVGRPALLFLDEPTASMDAHARRTTWDMLRGLRDRGVTILLTTHFIEEAERIADQVAILAHGRIIAMGPPDELRQRARKEVRITTAPAVEATALAAVMELAGDEVERASDGTLIIRREPSPEMIARLATWLAATGVMLIELRAGSPTLEQAFLEMTAEAVES